jgi:tetratricopeptide (TPR) repeat protein
MSTKTSCQCLPLPNLDLNALASYWNASQEVADKLRYWKSLQSSTGLKDEKHSNTLRLKGNELYKRKRLSEATNFYSKSLQYAPPNSTSRLLALANRSAALFELNCFLLSLIDIIYALKGDHSPSWRLKLIKRKVLCLNQLFSVPTLLQDLAKTPSVARDLLHDPKIALQSAIKEYYELSVTLGETVQAESDIQQWECARIGRVPVLGPQLGTRWISTDVDMKVIDLYKNERCIVAKHNIASGTTLLAEQPFIAVLSRQHHKVRCYECLGPLGLAPYRLEDTSFNNQLQC